jgi:hypothetical protein
MIKTKPYIIDYKKPIVFIGSEYVDLQGNIFKSSKELKMAQETAQFQMNEIVYCPHCHAGNRDVDWGFPREQKKKFVHKGQCPNCGERLSLEYQESFGLRVTVRNKKDEEPMSMMRVTAKAPAHCPSKLKWWPVSDGKLAIEIVSDLYFNRTMYGHYWLHREVVRHRFIFNFDTGLCYAMRGIDEKGAPSKYSSQIHRLQNCTFSYMRDIPYGTTQDFIEVVMQAMKEYKNIPFATINKDGDKNNRECICCNTKVLCHSLSFINYFSDMKLNDLTDMISLNHESISSNTKRVFRKLIALSKDGEVEWLPKYMQKRSIRNRLNKRVSTFFIYKWLHACGISDVNVMNRIIDSYIDEYDAPYDEDESYYMQNARTKSLMRIVRRYCINTSDIQIKFVRWALKGRNASSIYQFIKSVFDNQAYLLDDSARMYNALASVNYELPANVGTLKELHDALSALNNKRRFSNLQIEYSDEEKELEMDLDGYSFRLPKDTDSLYDIGRALNICVGSYGRRAAAKRCTIVTMSKDDKYVACIELKANKKDIVMHQLKGRFNHTVKEIEPVSEWVAATGISAQCYDYQNAVEHKTSRFDDRETDYAMANPRLNAQIGQRMAANVYQDFGNNEPIDDDGDDLPF